MSPVTYDSYESAVIANVISMLSRSANFQAYVGATGNTADLLAASAKQRIVEADGGDDFDNSSTENRKKTKFKITACDGSQFQVAIPIDQAFAKVNLGPTEHPSIGIGTFGHRGQAMVWYVAPAPVESAEARVRRARNYMGLIRTDLEALTGFDTNCLARFSITPLGPELGDDAGAYRHTVGFAHQIDWTAP